MIVHENLEQGSEAWLKTRLGRATASEASKILTPTGKLSSSRIKYMRKLARECVCDDPLEFVGNKATDWGNDHESEARELFERKMKLDVMEVGFCTRQDGIIGFSPDGLVGDWEGEKWDGPMISRTIKLPITDDDFNEVIDEETGFPSFELVDDYFQIKAGLEIKCPAPDKHVEYILDGELPSEYKLQVHWSLAASGLQAWWFMSYFPGLNPFIIRVEADDFTEKVKEAQDQFLIDYAPERERVLDAILPSRKGGRDD